MIQMVIAMFTNHYYLNQQEEFKNTEANPNN